jgi:hypothetical protein
MGTWPHTHLHHDPIRQVANAACTSHRQTHNWTYATVGTKYPILLCLP